MKKYSYNENINMLEVHPEYVEAGIQHAEKKGYSSLRFIKLDYSNSDTAYTLDLTPLRETDFIESISISDTFKIAKYDIEALYTLKNLKKLTCENKNIIFDYSRFNNLEELYVHYHKKSQHFSTLSSLKVLMLHSFSDQDCSALREFKRLEKLFLTGASVENLDGLEGLVNLQVFKLSYSSKVFDVTPAFKIPKLSLLHIEECKNIRDISLSEDNHSIEDLFVSEVDSLSFISQMKGLQKLKFWSLKDGQLAPIIEKNPPLDEVDFYPNKRYYSHTKEEIKQILKGK